MPMPSMPRRGFDGIVLLGLLGAGCAGIPVPSTAAATPAVLVEPEPVMLMPVPVATAPAPGITVPGVAVPAITVPAITVPAVTVPAVAVPMVAPPVIAVAPEADSMPAPLETAAAPPPATPVILTPEAAVAPPAPAPPAPAVPTAPTLDIAALTTRLRETDAIGIFTKLALKNQVDDLLKQVRVHYQAGNGADIAALRQPYNMLILKVLALVQDSDPSLASTIAGSREAIWGILADPVKFNAMT